MIRVNLLPHREIRRQRQQKQFFIIAGVVAAIGATIWVLVHISLSGTHDGQVARNQYLTEEIAKLDKEIADIKKLQELTASLLSRKKVVEALQANRAEAVHLMEELARQLPDGIYLRSIRQQGARVTVNGFTQSQARVSTLMRNLEASPHLESASLVEIRAVTAPVRANEFTLNVSLERAKEVQETKKPAAKK